MFGFAWLTLRQAQEALRTGRLEEAYRLLCQPAAQGHKKSFNLLQQVAQRFVERGERHLRNEDADAAWTDLLQAEAVGDNAGGADRLRLALVNVGLAQVRALLEAGEPGKATDAAVRLNERRVRHPDLTAFEEAAQGWVSAQGLAEVGEFARAIDAASRALQRLPALAGGPARHGHALSRFCKDLELREARCAPALVALHEAAQDERWRDVLRFSEQVLQSAPQHPEARRLRSLAWKAVVPGTVAMPGPEGKPEPPAFEEPPARFLLWIDGVGGYLICLSGRISLGQATPDAFVDVPLFADVGRLHATLSRDDEGYTLQATRNAFVNGQPAEQTLLRSGDRVTLGASCQLQFRQPSPLSSTARLELVSGHRLPTSVDAVLLMADALVLGPNGQAHVTVPDLKQPIVLFRAKEGLGMRYGGNFTVNRKPCRDRAVLGTQATVMGDDFSFALEPAGPSAGRIAHN